MSQTLRSRNDYFLLLGISVFVVSAGLFIYSKTTSIINEQKSKRQGAVLIIVMGVSATGKSTLAQSLAAILGMPYIDADDLHPKSNVEKMSKGVPLTDSDREPWLELIRTTAEHMAAEQKAKRQNNPRAGVVVACSALRKYYRSILRGDRKPATEGGKVPKHLEPPHRNNLPTYMVFLKGSREVLAKRIESRQGHFMKVGMLDSQLATLESPEGEDGVVVLDVEDNTEVQVEKAVKALETIW